MRLGDLDAFALGDVGLALQFARRRPSSPALMLLAALLAACPPEVVAHEPPPVRLFVLAGQSNMLQPNNTLVVPSAPEDAGIVVTALRFTMVPGPDPGTVVVPGGPGLAFARALARDGARVGLVGCAVGGSAIGQWRRGRPLYEECLAAVRATGLPVAGVLVAQGEVDSRTDVATAADGTPLNAAGWADAFGAFVDALRADLGQPDAPVLLTPLAHTSAPGTYGHWGTVRAQQDAAAQTIPGVVLVDPEPVDLAPGDPVHWDAASYDRHGQRLAAAYRAVHPVIP